MFVKDRMWPVSHEFDTHEVNDPLGINLAQEIAIVVEHQDRQNQLQLVTSYSLGRPILFPLQRQPVVSN
ncbi:hypothetical protein TNCV_1427311 [Trichonephila clavipes]|nr:hypothetical protein TNCV_1427311 [Trichonephila clavipes]